MDILEKIDMCLTEALEYIPYFVGDNLWLAYGVNSGMTAIMKNRTYLTDKTGDSNFGSIVRLIKKFAMATKPLKMKSNTKLYEVNVYSHRAKQKNFDIWGGIEKPQKKKFMTVDLGKITVVTFFDTKREAMGWVNTTV